MVEDPVQALIDFRTTFYRSLEARADEQFELCDAVLCADGPVLSLVGLSEVPEHRRGYGALYDGLNQGRINEKVLRAALMVEPLPRDENGRIVLAVDVSNWLRPSAQSSSERLLCHTHGRGTSTSVIIPGWPYSFIAALEPGRTSWTRILDARRLGPQDQVMEVTGEQLRGVIERIITAGHWHAGDPKILVLFDSGYNIPRLSWLLADLPVEVIGRLKSDRVFCSPVEKGPATVGRPSHHGKVFNLKDPQTWGPASSTSHNPSTHYGSVEHHGWNRLHPRLTRRNSWESHQGPLPIIEGTVIRLNVEHLPGDSDPKPLWLWTNACDLTPSQADKYWQAYLRRFDLEHTFRFIKQTLGWTAPQISSPQTADTWTWIIVAAHTQLALARHHTEDLRRPWEKPAEPHKLSPARTRRGFRYLHRKLPPLTSAPKPPHPGPGRPPGHKNKKPTPTYKAGKQSSKVK